MIRHLLVWAALLLVGYGEIANAGIFTTFSTDFNVGASAGATGPYANGWDYLWNSGGAIGTAGNYTQLVWNPGAAGYTEVSGSFPGPSYGGNYVHISPGYIHPGPGVAQSAGDDRFAIIAYTVPVLHAGPLYIASSSLNSPTGQTELQIYVDNTLLHDFSNIPTTAANTNFNVQLGNVAAGQTVYVALGPHTNHGSDASFLNFSLSDAPVAGVGYTTTYQTAFQGTTPQQGWQYLTNSDGVIGDPLHYQPLQWNTTQGAYVLQPAGSAPIDNSYVTLSSGGGHPGPGTAQGAGYDHYAIAAYTVPASGMYHIINSSITNADVGSITLRVDVNNNVSIVPPTILSGVSGYSFDTALFSLNAGDTVYFAVGPNGTHFNDSFAWNFTLALIPEPSSFLLIMAAVGSLSVLSRRRAFRHKA